MHARPKPRPAPVVSAFCGDKQTSAGPQGSGRSQNHDEGGPRSPAGDHGPEGHALQIVMVCGTSPAVPTTTWVTKKAPRVGDLWGSWGGRLAWLGPARTWGWGNGCRSPHGRGGGDLQGGHAAIVRRGLASSRRGLKLGAGAAQRVHKGSGLREALPAGRKCVRF